MVGSSQRFLGQEGKDRIVLDQNDSQRHDSWPRSPQAA
jgi:hypothetical protein